MIGRFELLREAGRGGFGIVFKARDRELRRCVALKTMRPGAPTPAAAESLAREIDVARLRHPNIVTVLEAGRCDRGPYVVFEYLRGETLRQRLDRGPLPLAGVLRVTGAIAGALACAHAQGVLHRDLKPSNVFLTPADGAKVIDFGLARVPAAEGPPGSGTAGYMSPEQRAGGPEDARSDLFALGLLIHEMGTGGAYLRADGTERPGPSAPRLPPALGELVAALVESDPARRPGSAGELLERLRTVERGLGGARTPCRRVTRAAFAKGRAGEA